MIKDRSFDGNTKMLLGFTSFEGSLEKDTYPSRFNKDNFRSAYREWPNEIYNQATSLDANTIDTLGKDQFILSLRGSPMVIKLVIVYDS